MAIAFSNPLIGTNKIGVGLHDGQKVWDDMNNHDYKPFEVQLTIGGKNLIFSCSCTEGNVDTVKVTIFLMLAIYEHSHEPVFFMWWL